MQQKVHWSWLHALKHWKRNVNFMMVPRLWGESAASIITTVHSNLCVIIYRLKSYGVVIIIALKSFLFIIHLYMLNINQYIIFLKLFCLENTGPHHMRANLKNLIAYNPFVDPTCRIWILFRKVEYVILNSTKRWYMIKFVFDKMDKHAQ